MDTLGLRNSADCLIPGEAGHTQIPAPPKYLEGAWGVSWGVFLEGPDPPSGVWKYPSPSTSKHSLGGSWGGKHSLGVLELLNPRNSLIRNSLVYQPECTWRVNQDPHILIRQSAHLSRTHTDYTGTCFETDFTPLSTVGGRSRASCHHRVSAPNWLFGGSVPTLNVAFLIPLSTFDAIETRKI